MDLELRIVNKLYNIFANEIADSPDVEVRADILAAIPKARGLLDMLEHLLEDKK